MGYYILHIDKSDVVMSYEYVSGRLDVSQRESVHQTAWWEFGFCWGTQGVMYLNDEVKHYNRHYHITFIYM